VLVYQAIDPLQATGCIAMNGVNQRITFSKLRVLPGRLHKTRTLYNLEAQAPVKGPSYEHAPHEPWGNLSSGLKGCGSLRNTAVKVFTELDEDHIQRQKKESAKLQAAALPPADLRPLCEILHSNFVAPPQQQSLNVPTDAYFAHW
jgi:hypothetical protein